MSSLKSYIFIENYKKQSLNLEQFLPNKSLKFIIIITFVFTFSLIYKLILDISYKIELKNDILKIEQYFKICNKEILLDIIPKKFKKFTKSLNPTISIISTIYNKEKYIIRFLRSIQNQKFKNIEIILIDDFSEDNSVKILEACQKRDERIKIIKHNKNKGILLSRNEGILLSTGKYIIIPDIDDLLSYDILNQCLIKFEQTNVDLIIFNTYLGNKNIFNYYKIKDYTNKIIFQPKLSFFMFYGSGHLEIIDPVIRNKFIKRTILINAVNCINDYYLNQNMIFYEDTLINFMLYKTSNSLYIFKDIGYFYISNQESTTKKYVDDKAIMIRFLKSFFFF